MNEAGILTTIFLFGLIVGLIVSFLINNITVQWKKIKILLEDNKEFAKKQAVVDKMRADGDFHDWIAVTDVVGTFLVCKKTGWCPDKKGFIPLELINSYLEKIKMEEEYKEYRNARVGKLAEELGFDLAKMESVVEKVFSIKKDFHVDRIAKLADDLSKRAEDVRNKQN